MRLTVHSLKCSMILGEVRIFEAKVRIFKAENHHQFGEFRDFPKSGVAFAAPTGGPEGVARCHLRGLGMRYDKN